MKKSKKKNVKKIMAFTLIELLAVIIILAVVAIIAVPIVLNVVSDAKKSAGQSETNMIYNGITNYCSTIDLKKQVGQLTEDDVDCSEKDSFTEDEIKKMVNLGNAKVIKVTYEKNKVKELVVESNGYRYTLQYDGSFCLGENCSYATPEECFTYEEIPDMPSYTYDIDYEKCVVFFNESPFSIDQIESICKGEFADLGAGQGQLSLDMMFLKGGSEFFESLKTAGVITNVVEVPSIKLTGYYCVEDYKNATLESIQEGLKRNPNFNYNIKNVVIPETINGGIVREIGFNTFGHDRLIESVIIPETVFTIGAGAFAGKNNNLTTITIPKSVLTIGFEAIAKRSYLQGLGFANQNLKTIINETGREFDWGEIVNMYRSPSAIFETGTVVNDLGNVEVIKK